MITLQSSKSNQIHQLMDTEGYTIGHYISIQEKFTCFTKADAEDMIQNLNMKEAGINGLHMCPKDQVCPVSLFRIEIRYI